MVFDMSEARCLARSARSLTFLPRLDRQYLKRQYCRRLPLNYTSRKLHVLLFPLLLQRGYCAIENVI